MGGGERRASEEVPDRVPWSAVVRPALGAMAFLLAFIAIVAVLAYLTTLGLVGLAVLVLIPSSVLVREAWRRVRSILDLRLGRGAYIRVGDYLVVEGKLKRSWGLPDRVVRWHWVELRDLEQDRPFAWVRVGESDAWTLRECLVVAMWTLDTRALRGVLTAPDVMITASTSRSTPPPGGVRPF